MDNPHKDRRKFTRRAGAAVVARRIEGGDPKLGRAVDLGMGGLRFQCLGLNVAVGEVIEATILVGDDSVTVVGKTVRVTDMGQTQEIALTFERVIDPEALERLCEPRLGEKREWA